MVLFIISLILYMREVKHGHKGAEYKDIGRKMFNTYLDINDPNGSTNRMLAQFVASFLQKLRHNF